jgi:uncharacterized protein
MFLFLGLGYTLVLLRFFSGYTLPMFTLLPPSPVAHAYPQPNVTAEPCAFSNPYLGQQVVNLGKAMPWHQLFCPVSGALTVTQLRFSAPISAPIRVLQLSDLHLDWHTQQWLTDIVNWVNTEAINPDIVVFTGDAVTKGTAYAQALTDTLAPLQAPFKLACRGNHDYKDGHGAQVASAALAAAGFTMLVNSATTLTLANGATLQVGGIDDFVKGAPNLPQLLSLTNPALPSLLLCHNPAQLSQTPHLAPYGLVLSGHTHGGQFKCPTWFARLLTGAYYVKGLHPINQHWLYVNSATGSAAVHFQRLGKLMPQVPVPRWGMRPEITLIDLVPLA